MGTYPHPTDRPGERTSDASTPDADDHRIPQPLPQSNDRKRSLAALLVMLAAVALIVVLILV